MEALVPSAYRHICGFLRGGHSNPALGGERSVPPGGVGCCHCVRVDRRQSSVLARCMSAEPIPEAHDRKELRARRQVQEKPSQVTGH